jgi:hypothetical protein
MGTPLSEGGGNGLVWKEGMGGRRERKRKKRLAVLSWSQYLNGRIGQTRGGSGRTKRKKRRSYLTLGVCHTIGKGDPAHRFYCVRPAIFGFRYCLWPSDHRCYRLPLFILGLSLRLASKGNYHILMSNPYDAHPSLSQLEAAVLWEYARLAQNVRMVCGVMVLCPI